MLLNKLETVKLKTIDWSYWTDLKVPDFMETLLRSCVARAQECGGTRKRPRGWQPVVIHGNLLKSAITSVISDQAGSISYWEEQFIELLSYAAPSNTVFSQMHNNQAPGADSI